MSCYDNSGRLKKGCVEEPTNSFYTKQQIDNMFEQFVLLQNNFVRVLELEQSDLSGSGTLKAQIVTYINNLNPALNVLEIDSKLNIHIVDYEETYELINLGKGLYGLGQLQITEANLFKISSNATSLVWVLIQDDVTAIPNTGYVTDALTKLIIDLPTENSTFTIRAVGNWRINLPTGVVLHFVDEIIDDYIESTDTYTSIELLHINNEYKVISCVGNIQYFNES